MIVVVLFMRHPLNLEKRLDIRKRENSFRKFHQGFFLTDFSSNDYLGFAASSEIFSATDRILRENNSLKNGSTGSRLLSGNHILYEIVEDYLARFHNSETALIFNSGYDANLGFFSSVPEKGDVVFYDEYIHASIRDGLVMSRAKAYKFRHNDIEDLQSKLTRFRGSEGNRFADVYVVTESVFSMDGDIPDLEKLSQFSIDNDCFLIVDEAHAVGIFGEKGEGLVGHLGLNDKVFARIVTFGKAVGVHGAAILGSSQLASYLVNFARSFIYTTGLPPHSIAAILSSYTYLEENNKEREELLNNISLFRSLIKNFQVEEYFLDSKTPIQSCIIPGNGEVKNLALKLQENGFDIKPVLSPTVPQGKERLRICLHSFNTEEEMKSVLKLIGTFII